MTDDFLDGVGEEPAPAPGPAPGSAEGYGGDGGSGSAQASGGVQQQRGYDHEVPVTPSYEGESQGYFTPTCDCGWAGTQQHGGQGAWDMANNEGVQHVQGAQDGKEHNFTIGTYYDQ